MYYFNRVIVIITVLSSIYFFTKGVKINLDESKQNQIVLNLYARIKWMNFTIAFVLILKCVISFFIKSLILRNFLGFSLLIDIVCLLFAERATSYFSSGLSMNPVVANVIIGIPILIILLNQIHYIYLLTIKRKKILWEIGFEEVLDK